MSDYTTQLSDAIVTALKEQDWAQGYVIERQLKPYHHLTQLDTLHITVTPRGRKWEILARGLTASTHTIAVMVQQHVTDLEHNEEVGELVEAIANWMLCKDFLDGTCTAVESVLADDRMFDEAHLRENSVFTSVLLATVDA